MKPNRLDDIDIAIEAWLTKHSRWLIAVLIIAIVYIVMAVYIPAFDNPRQGMLPGVIWNRANSSVMNWNLSNPSATLLQPIWNENNPSVRCTQYTGPRYRPDGDNDYNPVPENYPWLPQPYCTTCHSNSYVAYVNYTALAGGGGHPVAVGEQ